MKIAEEIKKYRSLDKEKLIAELRDLRKKAAGESLKVQAGKLDNYSLVKKTRKSIARLNSIIVEKNLES